MSSYLTKRTFAMSYKIAENRCLDEVREGRSMRSAGFHGDDELLDDPDDDGLKALLLLADMRKARILEAEAKRKPHLIDNDLRRGIKAIFMLRWLWGKGNPHRQMARPISGRWFCIPLARGRLPHHGIIRKKYTLKNPLNKNRSGNLFCI